MFVAGKLFQVVILIVALFLVAFVLRVSISFTRKQGNKLMAFSRFMAAKTGLNRRRKPAEPR